MIILLHSEQTEIQKENNERDASLMNELSTFLMKFMDSTTTKDP